MSTRSVIAIRSLDASILSIYCHSDGYVEHNGRILAEHYTDEAKVRELIALGDLSILGANIGVQLEFDNRAGRKLNDQCLAYGRDRGETSCTAAYAQDFDQSQSDHSQEYTYVFDVFSKSWYVAIDDQTRLYRLQGVIDEL